MSTENAGPNQGSQIEQKQSELREIRSDLRRFLIWLDNEDSELFEEIDDWISRSHDLPQSSMQARFQSRLAQLRSDPKHKLHPHRGVDTTEEAFPDDCESCIHYGGRCPVLADKLGRDTLQRHYDEAESDEDLLSRVSRFAADRHCVVLQEEIERGQQDYREFVKEGEQLRSRAVRRISNIDDAPDDLTTGDTTTTDGAASVDDGADLGTPPSEEIAQRVEAVTDAVTQSPDDEDGGGA